MASSTFHCAWHGGETVRVPRTQVEWQLMTSVGSYGALGLHSQQHMAEEDLTPEASADESCSEG